MISLNPYYLGLVAAFAMGAFLRRNLPLHATQRSTRLMGMFLIRGALPAAGFLAALSLPRIGLSTFAGPLLAWLMFILSMVAVTLTGRLLGWSRATTGCMILVCGLANTAIVGLPALGLAYDDFSLRDAMLVDQLGSFVALSILGIGVAQWCSQGDKPQLNFRPMVMKIIQFPPLIAIAIGLLIKMSFPAIDPSVQSAFHFFDFLKLMTNTIAPVGLLMLGSQLCLKTAYIRRRDLAVGLTLKLLLVPFFLISGVAMAGELNQQSAAVLLQLSMPTSLGGSVIAITHNLDSDVAASMPTIGIFAVIISGPICYGIIQWLL